MKSLYSPTVLIGEFPRQPTTAFILALYPNGQVAWSFGEAGFEVISLTKVPGGYVAGGNGTRAFDTSGQPLAGFSAVTLSPAESRVHALYYESVTGKLLIGGDFEEVNGEPIQYFAEIEGADVTKGKFVVNGPVRTIKYLERATWGGASSGHRRRLLGSEWSAADVYCWNALPACSNRSRARELCLGSIR